MEKEVQIAAKLYECRDIAKRFFRDEYSEKLRTYKNIIEGHQKEFNLDVLPSVYEICSLESVRDDGMIIILFMAAAVELIEPG